MMKKRARLGQRKRTTNELRMLFTARIAGGLVVEVLKNLRGARETVDKGKDVVAHYVG